MLMGDTPVSNTDPYATTPTSPDDWVDHLGAPVMIVTRATRVAKLAPGTLVRVEVSGKLRRAYGKCTKIGDLLP